MHVQKVQNVHSEHKIVAYNAINAINKINCATSSETDSALVYEGTAWPFRHWNYFTKRLYRNHSYKAGRKRAT